MSQASLFLWLWPPRRRVIVAGIVMLSGLIPPGVAAQSGWRGLSMPYDTTSPPLGASQPVFALAAEARLMGVPPLDSARLPAGVEELRIWVGFGVVVPQLLLRIMTTVQGSRGELVLWGNVPRLAESPADSFMSMMGATAGQYGCNRAHTGMKWTEVRNGVEYPRRNWIFACKVDFRDREPDWGKLLGSLAKLRIRDLPDPATLWPPAVRVLDGTSLQVEILQGAHYRTYMYDNPEEQPWPEARSAAAIIRIVEGLRR